MAIGDIKQSAHDSLFFPARPGAKSALQLIDEALPGKVTRYLEVVTVLERQALAGNIKAAAVYHDMCSYLIDRIHGKANQPISGGLTLLEVVHREDSKSLVAAIEGEVRELETRADSEIRQPELAPTLKNTAKDGKKGVI